MNTLKNKLNGKSDEPIRPEEIQDLVSEINRFSTVISKSKANLYLLRGLQRRLIHPDVLLSASIAECRTNAGLVPIALALRSGANKNLYLNTPSIGPAHVMVYTVSTLRDAGCPIQLINSVCLVLIQMGARTVSPAFDQGGNKVEIGNRDGEQFDTGFIKSIAVNLLPREASSPANLFTKSSVGAFGRVSTISVQEWFRSQGLSDYSSPEEVIMNLDKESRLIIGTICDNVKLAYPDGTVFESVVTPTHPTLLVPSFDDVLLNRAVNVGKALPLTPGLKISSEEHGENFAIGRCVDTGFTELFKHFLDQGLMVSYFTVTRICLLLKESFAMKDLIFVEELQTMLLYAVSRGINLDLDQMSLISTTNDDIAQMILNEYRQPYWRKICTGPQNVEPTKALQSLSFALLGQNVGEMTKAALCTQLHNLSQADPEALKHAAVERQRTRVSSIVASVQDFVGNKPVVTCRNKTVMQTDPFAYNDAQMSFYADRQGAVWCFTSDMYEGLVSRPINPHTNQELPIPFQHQLRSQLELLKQLGISTTAAPMSISEAVDNLNLDDDITNKNSQFIVETIIKTGVAIGISESKLRSLGVDQMNAVLATIGMKQPYLPLLTPTHAFTVFCRAAYVAIRSNSNISKTFFLDVTLQNSAPPVGFVSSGAPVRTEWVDPVSASRDTLPQSKPEPLEARGAGVPVYTTARNAAGLEDHSIPAYVTTYNDVRSYSPVKASKENEVNLLQTSANI
jgi:hypothetical protein